MGLSTKQDSDERELAHPAPFNVAILDAIGCLVEPYRPGLILDPFAGIGRVHYLPYRTIGVEIEREWAAASPGTIVGDATALPFPANTFDAIVTSPAYGNRMADHHEARDPSYRRTYRHLLGRALTSGSSAGLQWGQAYRELHIKAWTEAMRVTRPGGQLWLNCKNHVRKGRIQRVTEWHLRTLVGIGFEPMIIEQIAAPCARYGANGHVRLDYEMVIAFRKPNVVASE